MNPFFVLGVPRDADNARIRQAYLDAIRIDSPETSPHRFKEISMAYEKIKDEQNRFRYDLFDIECSADSPLDAFIQYARRSAQTTPLSPQAMKDFLRSCAKS